MQPSFGMLYAFSLRLRSGSCVICDFFLFLNVYIIKTHLFHLYKTVQIWPPLHILIATIIDKNTFTFPLNKCFSFLTPLLFT